ncbi:nuclear lim interactor-interacting factor [Leishmania donovani]|uniref:Mitochondrial import inner membrane translocase subunit TIM50 n=3 Tax=Leishmania donovani species complex TaxID=38574 RepID=A0A6L0Y3G0_LEIIN|nr:putative nuclear lim interactor-interacting factor [Leishmania infantum JPCM5]TPP49462.1 NLI interacting factor-like phosphatase family protein [Leishmania donovani]CAC9553451.1 nuclear_lim_interactor-interacting_factor_-_putative [Leishmania infantum]CAJ1994096.1 nuclear lim interactor-interacting factor [Leishmania donovani]CAM72494.1 putative nuclear lim interactor-interacting factor [Leishmania infantum JPCM5]SUZ47100.1 nuclear_lim_interactor-interacting_factor_-_putative [Leishmania in|eukprot:XP_001469387.1 putative nuclear lim interactor-interacting factor [Leishmania infantum JPCM5]
MPRQRRRGASFRGVYCPDAFPLSLEESVTETAEVFRRSPSITASGEYLVPPKPTEIKNRLTVVLDLDETLIYARQGPLYVRPGIETLMRFLADHCETIVWTSSKHRYADAVVAQIDTCGAVCHTVYRHRRWFNGTSATKELRLLGRDLETTIIVENTPDCCRGYERNAVLVEDYEGGELADHTLHTLLALLRDLVERHEKDGITVPEYIATTPRLAQQNVLTDKGTVMQAYCLLGAEDECAAPYSTVSKYPRINRDHLASAFPRPAQQPSRIRPAGSLGIRRKHACQQRVVY